MFRNSAQPAGESIPDRRKSVTKHPSPERTWSLGAWSTRHLQGSDRAKRPHCRISSVLGQSVRFQGLNFSQK